jgi:hypothetical protein
MFLLRDADLPRIERISESSGTEVSVNREHHRRLNQGLQRLRGPHKSGHGLWIILQLGCGSQYDVESRLLFLPVRATATSRRWTS